MNIEIKSAKWNTQAALFLEPACDEAYSINELAYDVQSGNCFLFDVYEGHEHIGSQVLRLEKIGSGHELVVVALGGKSQSANFIQSLSRFWDELALKNNAKTVRAHVSKKGMAKLMERVGGVLSEWVYKREVIHGR